MLGFLRVFARLGDRRRLRTSERAADRRVIAASGLVDREVYLRRNSDADPSRVDPIDHYLLYGWAEGRDPHVLFDTRYYLAENEDVRRSGANPLAHFVTRGMGEGRDPHPLFDAQ